MTHRSTPGRITAGALASILFPAIIGLLVLLHFGAFPLTASVVFNERTWTVPDSLASVDHPFHAARASLLLEDLRSGTFPRWVGNHQGGYPVEFYPFGVAWLDVGMWGLLAGQVSIAAIHKLVVLLILILPVFGFWWMARGDKPLPAGISSLALAFHVAIPGDWRHGGSTELVNWGLVTNVAGAAFACLACVAIARWVLLQDRDMALAAVATITLAVFTNPRSLIAIVIAGVAILIVSAERSLHGNWVAMIPNVRRMVEVAVMSLLICAPLLFSLLRYNDLYYFRHYDDYTSLQQYWDASVAAVSVPVAALALLGVAFAVVGNIGPVARSMALTLILYLISTALLTSMSWAANLVQQLETTRMMPFQRLLVVYFAALGLVEATRRLTSWARAQHGPPLASSAWGIVAILIVGVSFSTFRPSFMDQPGQQFITDPVATTAEPAFVSFRSAIQEADRLAPAGSAILVLGNEMDRQGWWHEQLWAPTETDRPLFYDDWLWYWQTSHNGPQDPAGGHFYPNPDRAIDAGFFATHGIGVVVMTGTDVREAASSSQDLGFVRSIGEWEIYTVAGAPPIITNGNNAPSAVRIEDDRITATFQTGSGEILIRRNWFPRWRATVNGSNVPVEETDDGYMQIVAPTGQVDLVLIYTTNAGDWLARVLSVVGVVTACAIFVVRRRPGRNNHGEPGVVGRSRLAATPQ